MESTRTNILSLRPNIPTIKEASATNIAEQFQNKTLRPILKFQNELLLHIFQSYIKQRKNVFYQLSDKTRLEYIGQSIRKDLKFKNRLVGIIIGLFTMEEYEIFLTEEKELTRRITNLLVQRLESQVAFFNP